MFGRGRFHGLGLVLSNLRETNPSATDAELRVLLFDRLYADELDPAQHASVVSPARRTTVAELTLA